MPITNTIFFSLIISERDIDKYARNEVTRKKVCLSQPFAACFRKIVSKIVKITFATTWKIFIIFFSSQNCCLFQQSKQNKSFWLNQISQIIVYFCLFCMWFETIYKQNTLTNMNVNKIIWCWLLPSRWFLYRIIGLINQRQFVLYVVFF